MNTVSILELNRIAKGLNIEGGYPYHYLIRDNLNKKVLWANIVLVLDRPFIDNILFEDLDTIMKKESYLLLENTIDEINEHKMFSIYLMTIGYYLEHGKTLLNKLPNDKLHITIHVHQDVLSVNMIYIIQKHLDDLCKHFLIDMSNTILDFRTDKHTFVSSDHDYTNTDILLSLSQCAGLDEGLRPGDIIIPKIFIPFDVENKTIDVNKFYIVKNHFGEILENLLISKYHEFSIKYVNDNYLSLNKNKKYKAIQLCIDDFNETPILQVNALWNPDDIFEKISVNQ